MFGTLGIAVEELLMEEEPKAYHCRKCGQCDGDDGDDGEQEQEEYGGKRPLVDMS